jgi:ribosomal protein S18 acetylase RimI-like enzyme
LTDAPYAFGAKLDDVLAETLSSFDATASRHAHSDISTSFIAFVGDEAVGTIGAFLEQQHPNRSFICALWLEPNQRGKSVASELVHTASAWLQHRSKQAIFAWVADSNHRALAFYRKLGFIPTEERQPLPSNSSEYETLLRLDGKGS